MEMSPVISLAVDVSIFLALVVAIYYCIKLSRQFDEMKNNQKAFETLIKSMNTASSKAEGAIKNLKLSLVEEGGNLEELINKAKGIENELEIIIQAGDSLADRIEKASSSRGADKNIFTEFVEDDLDVKSGSFDDDFKTIAERELLEAVRQKRK